MSKTLVVLIFLISSVSFAKTQNCLSAPYTLEDIWGVADFTECPPAELRQFKSMLLTDLDQMRLILAQKRASGSDDLGGKEIYRQSQDQAALTVIKSALGEK